LGQHLEDFCEGAGVLIGSGRINIHKDEYILPALTRLNWK